MKNKNIKAEQISFAIGEISDNYIESANALRMSDIKNAKKSGSFIYKQFAGIAAAVMVLTVGTIFMLRFLAPDDVILPPDDGVVAPPVNLEPEPEIGYIIQFGDYDWRVLDVQDGKALIITENITESRTYHSDYVEMTWEQSDIRAYLNGEFYNSFSSEERERIIATTVINDSNRHGISGGNDTTDKIFLLSINEANIYFADDSARIAFNADSEPYSWWLRSPGFNAYMAAQVKSDGNVFFDVNNQDVNNVMLGVRPAMWVRFAPPVEPAPDPETGYTWVVEPTLEYEWINYCALCNMFVTTVYTAEPGNEAIFPDDNYTTFELDRITGQFTGEIHESHQKYSVSGMVIWVYDPDLDLFGWFQWISMDVGVIYELYPMSEFAEHFPKEFDRIRTVRRYDTTVATRGSEFLPGEGYSGDAVMYGDKFITDFEYDMQSNPGRQQPSIISIHDSDGNDGSNYGIMNKDGVLIVPFDSWMLVTITETTAFANRNGKWGIIGFGDYVPPETTDEPQPAKPAPQQTEEEILLTEFVGRVCAVRGMMPYFNDIKDVELRTFLQQYFNVYGWDWSDTDVFSDGAEQHHYNNDEVEQLRGSAYFGAVLGVSPARLDNYMQEYFNPDFSIESYDYKNMPSESGIIWDSERELIVSFIYGGSPHMWRSSHIIEISEPETGIYSVYALKVEWGEGYYITNMEYIRCVFTRNVNGNFNIMYKRLVPQNEYPEWLSAFLAFMDIICNDVDVAYEYAVVFDVFAEMNEMRSCWDCNESPRNLCDGCIVSGGVTWIIFREAFEKFRDG